MFQLVQEASSDHDQRGATAVEYALLVALIAGVLVTVILLLGHNVFGLFELTNDSRW